MRDLVRDVKRLTRMANSSRSSNDSKQQGTARNSRATVSGPAQPDDSGLGDILAEKVSGGQAVAAAFPFNANKAAEYPPADPLHPPAGTAIAPADPIVGASTVTESNGSDKVGSGGAEHRQEPDGRVRWTAFASTPPAGR